MHRRILILIVTIALTLPRLPSVSGEPTTAGTIGSYAGLVVGSAILAIVFVYAAVIGLALTKRILQGPETDTKK